jgi:hypothetical protein
MHDRATFADRDDVSASYLVPELYVYRLVVQPSSDSSDQCSGGVRECPITNYRHLPLYGCQALKEISGVLLTVPGGQRTASSGSGTKRLRRDVAETE